VVAVAGEAERVDRIFVAVTLAVMIPLAVFTVAAVYYYASAGVAFGFLVWVVAIISWSKVTRSWLDERIKLSREASIIGEEIRRLREAIDALRRSLES